MENSQGDKVPNKIEIGPPLPPAGPLGLRENLEVGQIAGEPNVSVRGPDDAQQDVLCTSRPTRRSSLVKDLEAQLRGLSSGLTLPESLITDTEALAGDTEDATHGADAETATVDAESTPDHTVCLSDRETLQGDADSLRASFSQDFSEKEPRPKSPVPELPPLDEPEIWLPSLSGAGLLEVPSATTAPPACQPTVADREEDESSPFEELMIPAPFEYDDALSAAAAAPNFEQEKEQPAHSDSLTPLESEHVELQVPEQKPGDTESSSPSPSSPLLPVASETNPQDPLDPTWTEVALSPLECFLSQGPQLELEYVEGEGPWVRCEELGGTYVRIKEPGPQDYAQLVPKDALEGGAQGGGSVWGCSFLCCSKRTPIADQ